MKATFTRHKELSIPATPCICLLFALVVQVPVRAQDAAANISRAQRTLSDIDALIGGIMARNASASTARRPVNDGWVSLFDGKSLAGWKRTDFGGGGEARIDTSFRGGPPAIVVDMGATLSGITWMGEVPRTRYELSLETMKIDGNDFQCGLTFPVGNSYASLILGGWGGGVVGISSIDNSDASENETTKYIAFPKDKWFRVQLRVTPEKIEAWLDDRKIVDQVITNRKITLRPGDISRSIPLGLSTYQTTAAWRAIRIRPLDRSG